MDGFYREVPLGAVTVVIRLERGPVMEQDGTFLFGYPIGKDAHSLSPDNVAERIDSVGGYFLFLSISRDRVVVANDICGGYRLYHCRVGDKIYLSDNYSPLLALMRAEKPPVRNEVEYHLWVRQRYTSGDRTFVVGLNKLAPASMISITADGIRTSRYFRETPNRADARKHISCCRDDLSQSIRSLIQERGSKLLFFSGGADSTLLALLMKKEGVEFTPVFLLAQPRYRANHTDYQRARAVARQIDLELVVEEVGFEEALVDLPAIIDRMLFDRHLSLLHFAGAEQLARRYGYDSVFVSGQGADSIFSLGPSARTRGDLAARVLMRWPDSFTARLAAMAVRKKHGNTLRGPRGHTEFLSAFFNPYDYYAVIDTETPDSIRDYLRQLIQPLDDSLSDRLSLMMYLKLYGFIQGSDNQVVIQSARHAEISRVVLPYATPGIIYGTARYQSVTRELLSPKYVVAAILKQLGYVSPPIEADTTETDADRELRITNQVAASFHEAGDGIFASPSVGAVASA